MPTPKIVSKNQFGEEQVQTLLGTTSQALVNSLPSKTGVAALVAISTADATDLPTAITLVNACKAQLNSLLAALKLQS